MNLETIVIFITVYRQGPRWKNCRDFILCNVVPDVNTLPAPFAVMTGGVKTTEDKVDHRRPLKTSLVDIER